jgi:WD40 repeat protein
MHLDTSRNYLFTGSYDDGEINVFDLDKPGREKLAKLNATLVGKEKIRAITWSAKRAEIITGTADGSITFWNAVEGKSICKHPSIKTSFRPSTQRSRSWASSPKESGSSPHPNPKASKFGPCPSSGETPGWSPTSANRPASSSTNTTRTNC